MASQDVDLALALSLQEKYNNEDLQEIPQRAKGIIDKHWELEDPNPNVHKLFVEFDSTFFWGKLAASGVAVDWSKRMTMCAGVCSYENRAGFCSIRLSLPLLKLRPRKDLVETLLHEMIHAYLFVTHNNKDHDGHGPQFLSHMHRINSASGARITVFHTFHQEVKEYRQHWWKCSGPCQHKSPFFGLVMRATNRPPSPRDLWWDEHQRTCGGNYAKIKEPEGYRNKGRGGARGQGAGRAKGGETERPNRDIRELLGGTKQKGDSSRPTSQRGAENPPRGSGAFEGRGFVLGKGGRGKKKGKQASEVSAGAFEGGKLLGGREERSESSFEGQGSVLGKRGREEDCDENLRTKVLRAAEERARNEVAIHRVGRNSKGRKDISHPTARNPPRWDIECIIISDDGSPDKTVTVIPSSPPEHATVSPPAEEDAVHVIESPDQESTDDHKICPVCGMGNIPAAIINIHTSLCLESEEEFRTILDEEDL